MYLLSFAAARKEIRIGTAYFVPDDLTIQALTDARKRGVRVRVIVPGPHNDVPVSGMAGRALWGKMLEAGVEFYEYQPTMYHVKMLIVDDRWVSIGSTNLDNRSFRLNAEANLNVLDPKFAAEQSKIFDEDLAKSKAVSLEEWKNRPFNEKFSEGMATLLKWQL
jgi:cardiolipin synthase